MQCALSSCSEAATQKCAACGTLGYCSREHQRSDWKTHKKECQRIVKAAAASGEGGAAGGGAPDSAPEGKGVLHEYRCAQQANHNMTDNT